jgi:predicted alpha/beta superfamily hydrolase
MVRALVLCACMAATGWTQAQRVVPPAPFVLGVVETIRSQALGQDRLLNIILPQGYHADTAASYPVLYVLDGSADEDIIHVAGAVQFASFPWIAWLRPCIVVGIANVDRKHDLTHPTTIAKDKADFPTTGGSEAFLRFVGDEVVPFIAANYRTSDQCTLIGQSLGGLFATEVLLRRPALFQHYLIVSPSLWWDNGSVLQLPPTALMDPAQAPVTVYVAVGKEHPTMVRGARQLAALVRRNHHTRVGHTQLTHLDHATILHQAVVDWMVWRGK